MVAGKNNDYRDLFAAAGMASTSELESRASLRAVTVVVPTYNRTPMLARTLAGLFHQTYPRTAMHIVIADDGSDDDIERVVRDHAAFFNITHVRQAKRGHRLAAVCNLGIRASSHSAIVLLQCDMIPAPGLVSAYLQALAIAPNAVLIGMRRFVDASGMTPAEMWADATFTKRLPAIATNNEMWPEGSQARLEDWRHSLYRRTNDLVDAMWPFEACVGSNLAFERRLYERVGGFSEEFEEWGGEDGEFGYRAYNAGYYFVPVHRAVAFHQEPPNGINETSRLEGSVKSFRLREEKCPLPRYRKEGQARQFAVPKVSMCVFASGLEPSSPGSITLDGLRYWDAEVVTAGAASASFEATVRRMICGSQGPYLLIHSGGQMRPNVTPRLVNRLDTENIGAVVSCDAASGETTLMFRRRDWNRLTDHPGDTPLIDLDALIVALRRISIVRDDTGADDSAMRSRR